jgi:hypothetical protein
MANRTLKFYGIAYGSVPVQLNAHINGEVVFSGEVPTTNQPFPEPTDSVDMTSATVLFTVDNNPLFHNTFMGSYPMTISVATGDGIYVQRVNSNYTAVYGPDASVISLGTADNFVQCYQGWPANSENTPDCRSSVQIDGVTQVPPLPASTGQWTWRVPQGSTLACNFNVAQGNIA